MVGDNCPLCLLGPFVYVYKVIGFTPYQIKCEHSDKTNKIIVDLSKKWLVVPFTLALALLASCAYHIYHSLGDVSKHNPIKIFTDSLLGFNVAFSILSCMALRNRRAREQEITIWLMTRRARFGLEDIFGAKPTSNFRRIANASFAGIVLAMLLSELWVWCVFSDETVIFRIAASARSVCVAIELTWIVECYTQCKSYKVILSRCDTRIEDVLSGACFGEARTVGADDDGLVVQLKRLQIYRGVVIDGFRQFAAFMGPLCILQVVLVTVALVFNIFLSVGFYIGEVRNLTGLELGIILGRIGVGIALNICRSTLLQDLANSSEDILSFLFRYPISKLNAAEAAQVEMMITTLQIQKPILRASDIFTVGTRLLASISGTVVTYVLVALQFHASWTK